MVVFIVNGSVRFFIEEFFGKKCCVIKIVIKSMIEKKFNSSIFSV